MKRKIIKSFLSMKTHKIIIISALLSLFLAILAEINDPSGNYIGDLKGVLTNYFPMIFLNVTPLMLVFRVFFLRKIRENPLYAVGIILYFLLFVPLFLKIQTLHGEKIMSSHGYFYIGVTTLNLLAITIGHLVLFKYVFVDIILKRRKPRGIDTIVVFMTYITLGVSFGFLYALVSILSGGPAFTNMNLEMAQELGNTKLYFRHIYYSFITLTSVGYGDIYPTSWVAQTISVIEAVFGVFLLSFSLGILLSTEAETNTVMEDEDEKFKADILKGIEEIIDKKLDERDRKKK